jgi:hypothetical protein
MSEPEQSLDLTTSWHMMKSCENINIKLVLFSPPFLTFLKNARNGTAAEYSEAQAARRIDLSAPPYEF